MARKRMLSNDIINSPEFYALSNDAKLAYIYINLSADDDGFVSTAAKELYPIHVDTAVLDELVEHGYLLEFKDENVYVVTHFFMHNARRMDRYTPTYYSELKECLSLDKHNKYIKVEPSAIEHISNLVATDKSRLDKSRIDKIKKDSCTESGKPPDSMHPDVEGILCTDGSIWYPTFESYERYKKLYPGVDIDREFFKMAQWCIDNPKRRKTRGGCGRFASSWLDRAQNSRYGKPKAIYSQQSQISYIKEQETLKKEPVEMDYDEEEAIRKALEALAQSEGGG